MNIEIKPIFRVIDFIPDKIFNKKTLKKLPPIKADVLNITLDYPLNNPYTMQLTNDQKRFSIVDILENICKAYKIIYEIEEQTANTKTIPMEQRGPSQMVSGGVCIVNRNTTNGRFGIWGHDIEDLWVEGLRYYPETKTIKPIMGS